MAQGRRSNYVMDMEILLAAKNDKIAELEAKLDEVKDAIKNSPSPRLALTKIVDILLEKS